MYLLDTNVLSELRKRSRADANVKAWSLANDNSTAFVSVITIHEIEKGALRLERRDPAQGAILRQWLVGTILHEYSGRILDIDPTIARTAAALHVPDRQPELDALIAATALTHGLTVVTRNATDFAPMGVPVLNPWNAPP